MFYGFTISQNSKLLQHTSNKFVIPNGLKIFWGSGQCSSTGDPAGVYSIQITFPESFSNDKYSFVVTRRNYSGDNEKNQSAYSYYQKTKDYIWVGNSFGPITFDWIAVGY